MLLIALFTTSPLDTYSSVNQRTLEALHSSVDLAGLKFARQKYCEKWGCTAVWTHQQPAARKTSLVRTPTGVERRTMPPYYNKMILLKQYVKFYDYIVFLDADVVITNFDLNITDFVLANPHGIAFNVAVNVFSKHSPRSMRLLNLWHDSATGDGCRYRRFPYNYRSQTLNGDMPWFWYAMLRLYEEHYTEHVDCIQPCSNTSWVYDCAMSVWRRPKAQRLLSTQQYAGKRIMREMQWGNSESAVESAKGAWMLHIKANNKKFSSIADAINRLHRTGKWLLADAAVTNAKQLD